MKNPTDLELDLAFAEYVVKAVSCDSWRPFNPYSMIKGDCGHSQCYPRKVPVKYTDHAEAVLPWLEKMPHWRSECVDYCQINPADKYLVRVFYKKPDGISDNMYLGVAPTLAKAAIIALLRAHGIEVGFT